MVTLTAGRELDALVAERVMGASVLRHQGSDGHDAYFDWGDHTRGYAPAYSTDIAAAWAVVEHLKQLDLSLAWHNSQWVARFIKWGKVEHSIGEADTGPLAICLAALKAVEK